MLWSQDKHVSGRSRSSLYSILYSVASCYCATGLSSAYLDSFFNKPPASHEPANTPKIIQTPLTSSLSNVLVWNLLSPTEVVVSSWNTPCRFLVTFKTPRSFGRTASSAISRKTLRKFETFGSDKGCSKSTCSWMGSKIWLESAREESPATMMTFGTCGTSGRAGLTSAFAREDSQKSGVNGYKRTIA
jgi:hypothetical protein